MVKMGALAALGTVACTSKDHFQNYYSMVMPYLKVILMSAINEPNRMLLAKSIECITMVWTAVGKEKFKADTELLIISNTVGTITLVSLTGLVVFILFTLAANINAIVISLLASLVAAGSFLALFFACVTAIYIGALSIAFFVISVATSFTIVAIVIATGWIGFFWTVWLATKKSFGIAKHSLTATGSAISTYSSARQARHLLKTLSD
ncbi:Importin-5 [Quillaja saponaria]|uniref:Importin-5 n=1 Tax=Quillaja saponaria TaxID=32244 RepID=A0AAD7PR42_QUISA|nr:Importin-5 [Quillaja saponaria]